MQRLRRPNNRNCDATLHSVALNERASTTRLNKPWYSILKQKHEQIPTIYPQLSGMNNWLCTVITIFAQRFNICSPKFRGRRPLSLPPGYAPSNSDKWLRGFCPFVVIANPLTSRTGHEKTFLAWLAKSATD